MTVATSIKSPRTRVVDVRISVPFDISLPADTLEAIEETERGGGTLYSSVSELKRDLGLR